MDKEVLREIWHGKLPLCFRLHPDDVNGMHRPEPYYMMVSRVTYFPLVLDRVIKYFYRFMDQSKQTLDNIWLDYEGQPIKWHHPIGLSWDLFGSSYDLPWRLILHFSEFPSKEIVRCNTKSLIEINFMSAIKEADELKHKGSVIQNMVKKDHNQLWSSLVNDKFDQFWSINEKLMEKTRNELFKYIPFRLYFPDYTYLQKTIKPCTTKCLIFQNSKNVSSSETGDTSPQMPIVYDYDTIVNKSHKCSHTASTIEDDSKEKVSSQHRFSTMLDLIQVCFTDRLNELLVQQEQSGEEKSPIEAPIDVNLFKYRFLSHGIEVPFSTPLHWLSEHFSYPDNFLHICAVVKDKNDLS